MGYYGLKSRVVYHTMFTWETTKGVDNMLIKIQVESMKEAEHLSQICKDYDSEILLRGAGKFCIDPKSTLGICAMMYSARDNMVLDTGDMPEEEVPAFISRIERFIEE